MAIFKRILLLIIPALFLTGCSDQQGGGRTLTVSVEPQRCLLEEIVGDRYEVTTLLGRGANPETFEPTMKARMALENSPVFFQVGGLPFEQSITSTLGDGVKIVNTSDGIVPVYGTHDHGDGDDHVGEHNHGDDHVGEHNHGGADPHTWTSVKNMRVMARNMLNVMNEIDPAGKNVYEANFKRLDQRLDSLDHAIASRLASLEQRSFAVWHPSLSYFARDYGLTQISVGFENKEMSPRFLAEVTEHAKAEGVRVLFFQKEYDSRQASTLCSAMGAQMVTINPLDYDWEAQLTAVANALVK